MSWHDTIKEVGGGLYTFLSTDGETITFIVVGDPVILTTTYQKNEQIRLACPIVTEEGFVLLIIGKRLARKISKYEKVFDSTVFTATRHGKENDPNTKYSLDTSMDKDQYMTLDKIREDEYNEAILNEAIEAAKDLE